MTDDAGQRRRPVLLIVFNRPEKTRRMFDSTRATAPRRLFIAADRPRPDERSIGEMFDLVVIGTSVAADVLQRPRRAQAATKPRGRS